MPVTVALALMLTRAARSRFLPNKSIGLNILAIAAGVAFLAFAISIYDGYKRKVDRIIFSLTPHVTLRPLPDLGSSGEGTERDERAECVRVCRAPSSVHRPNEVAAVASAVRLDKDKLSAVSRWIASQPAHGVSSSRVLFEEVKLEIRAGKFSSGGARPMRLLGVETLTGSQPSPRVDLTFADDHVRRRFAANEGVLISDTLAGEIAEATGDKVVPGRFKLTIGPIDSAREIAVIGVHRLGIHSIARNLIIAPYVIAEALASSSGLKMEGPTYVGLTLADPPQARALVSLARPALRAVDVTAVAWQSLTDLFDQLELYRWIIVVTLSLAILVTAINTFVNINILIMDRAQHIGILRAMGLTPWRLIAVFVVIGLLQAFVGTALGYGLGIVIGYGLDDYINSLVREFVPISEAGIAPDPAVFLSILAFVAVVNVATCLLAGRRALSLDIAENLRGA